MKHTIIILLIGALLGGCNSWLDLAPENERLSEEYWTSKEDVQNTMMSCYSRLRECQELMLQWGEMRADVLVLTGKQGENLTKMNKQNLTSDNDLVKWNSFYKVINAANAIIQYGPGVLQKDPLFTEEASDQFVAEAKTVRALAYFYLIRTFRDVPLITDAYLLDIQELKQPKTPEKEIIDRIILDLQWSLKRLNVSYSLTWENKCRATRWAAQTLLADIYLWNEQYKECMDACQLIMNSERFRLVGATQDEEEEEDETNREKWFDIFYPGLTDESIWELYYDYENNQRNNLFNRFIDGGFYKMNTKLADEFGADENAGDVRGLNNTYIKDNLIWKYVGITNDGNTKRSGASASPNWILYRYADVVLMYAEACTMYQNNEKYRLLAMNAINLIRNRAGVTALKEDEVLTMSERDLLQIILNERKKEFVAEGKRWYDLVRIAKKNDYLTYKQMVVDILLENVPMAEKAIYQTKLSNPYSLYLPIYKNEIDMGKGVLVQNPAYQ